MKRWFSSIPILGAVALLTMVSCDGLPTETAVSSSQPDFKKGGKPGGGGGGEEQSPDPAILFTNHIKKRSLGVSIHVMNADGSNTVRVLSDNLESGQRSDEPQWAPDGARLVFIQTKDGTDQVATVNVDGPSFTVVHASQASRLEHARWSPVSLSDGEEKIAYVETPLPATWGSKLVVSNVDGSSRVGLVDLPGEFIMHLEWSRLGDRIAATVWDGTQSTLRLYEIDCSAGCVSNGHIDVNLSWPLTSCSNGYSWSFMDQANTKDVIVTSAGEDCGASGSDFYTIDFTGSLVNPVVNRLTTTLLDQDGATWSPDDSQIAFTAFTGRSREAFVMSADGTGASSLGAKMSEVNLDWKR